MKLNALIICLAIVLLNSCTKVKVETSGPPPIFANDSVTLPISDTNVIYIGEYSKMSLNVVKKQMDLSLSPQIIDSVFVDIDVAQYAKAIRIQVKKDTINADGGTYFQTGVYVTVLDSAIKMGKLCNSMYYAAPMASTINFTTFCSENYTNPAAYKESSHINIPIALYLTAKHTTGAELLLNTWKNQFKGEGYLAFRYLLGTTVKYGWIRMQLASSSQIEVTDCAF